MLGGLLPGMRDTVIRTLADSVVIQRWTRSRTPTGGATYVWVAQPAVAGRLMATNSDDIEFANKMGISATNALLLPFDTAIAIDDRFSVAGVVYVVTGVLENSNPVLIKVLAAKMEL